MTERRLAFAVDVGGTRLKAGIVEIGSGRVLDAVAPRPSGSWEQASAEVAAVLGELRTRTGAIDMVGLAMPGVLDGGVVVSLPGKLAGVEGQDVAAHVARMAGVPSLVLNDAVAAAIGEAAGEGSASREGERTLVLTLGTGVGVCVVEGGAPVGTGPLGGGLLGGQVPLGGDDAVPAEVCAWTDTVGRTGTIEARVRADALVAHAALLGLTVGGPGDVFASHDEAAAVAIRRYRSDLIRAIVALAHAHAPHVVVVGGGVIEGDAGVLLGAEMEAAVNAELAFGLQVRVRRAALGARAALAGLGVAMGTRS